MCNFGFIKQSLVDYPGEVCSVIFMPGCNFYCNHCHNKLLSNDILENGVSLENILAYLRRTKEKLTTAVCVTGGEPTLRLNELDALVKKLRCLGLKIKLDTNGSQPDIVRTLSVDYIAIDLKTSPQKYHGLLTGIKDIEERLLTSIRDIIACYKNSAYEFRTTLVSGLVTVEDVKKLGVLITNISFWYFQIGRNKNQGPLMSSSEVERIIAVAKNYSENVFLRN